MRFGTPQCGVAVELPTPARRSGWSRVSSDVLRNVWTVDAETQREVFLFSSEEVASWTSLFGENQAVHTLPAGTTPVTSIEPGDRVIALVHGDGAHTSWTWAITHLGTILLIDATTRSVISSHRIGAEMTAVCRMGSTDLIVATRGPSASTYSEVIALSYSQDNSSRPPTVKGKALFRLGDKVECLCIATSSSMSAANTSVLSTPWDPDSHRQLLFSITEHGNIDVWDLVAACDATSEFHDLHYSSEELGGPTCAAVVGSAIWIGTSFGPVVVCPVNGEGSYEVLQHHKAKVTSIFPMTLASRVWSCCADGVVAVWSVARKKPCGQFDIQATPMLSLQQTQPQLLTSVWGVDARHRATCWEVREDFTETLHVFEDAAMPLKDRGGSASPRRNTREAWVGFVGTLCDVLTGRTKECSFPPLLLDERDAPEEARYLPDALISLSECREMIFDTFRDLQWQSVSLSEDVKYLAKHAKGHRRAYSRAAELAEKLSMLTPTFPLPTDVDDPVERLVIAAECVLEEVMDQGVLRDPRQSRNVSRDSPPPAELDRSGIPQAQSLSEHIFETQMRTLEARLEAERNTSEALRKQLKEFEDENDRLVSDANTAREQADRFSSDADRWRKAHVTSKKRLQSSQEQHDAEKMALAQELDTARIELAAARSAPQPAPLVEDKRKKAPFDAFRVDTNKIVSELGRLLQHSCEEQRTMRAASLEVLDELAETKASFLEMEEAGKRMIEGFEAERLRALDDLTALHQQVASRSVNVEGVQRRLQSIIAVIGGGGPGPHDVPATPPRGPLRVAF
ncbi:threonine synthase, putative [Bodo saltans]|uniref:Threonine synthase, putative n=1 Tax=Bodo saltans TaxID=75058 RepID=A0A0S4JDE2_BODSA|nr:threonine synthase, putative [Bodo saltans]|eukprot:CUG88274.1 threonine synthase, putative [Bodo saltans]